MKIKILNLTYQRNGVHADSFYHCLAEITDGIKRKMLVTFQTQKDDAKVNLGTCRAVNLDDLSEKWRGDEIGIELNKELYKQCLKVSGTIYDCITIKTPIQCQTK